MALFTHGRALVIGVGEYQDSRWNAPVTVADAQGVAQALSDPAVSAYPADHVQFPQGTQATRDGVTTALQQLGA